MSTRRPLPWLSVLLNLLLPPAGHFYLREPARATALLALQLAFWCAAAMTPLSLLPGGLALIVLLAVGYRLFVLVDVLRLGRAAVTAGHSSMAAGRLAAWMTVLLAAGWAMPRALDGVRRVQAYRMPTRSMEPAILVGDFFLVDRGRQARSTPRPGDLLAVVQPGSAGIVVLKRCVALAGDEVRIEDGELQLNGVPAPEALQGSRASSKIQPRGQRQSSIYRGLGNADQFGPLRVPAGQLFLLGDSRDRSADSRFFGPVPVADVIGRAELVYWSWDGQAGKPRWDRIGIRVAHAAIE